jgi:hypothetical protein
MSRPVGKPGQNWTTRGTENPARPVRIFSAVATVLLIGTGSTPAAGTAAADSAVRPTAACGDLVHGFALPGAATHVTSAAVVATGAEPEYRGAG